MHALMEKADEGDALHTSQVTKPAATMDLVFDSEAN